jgi:hypothetical protein
MIKNFATVDGVEKEVKGVRIKKYCDFCKKEIVGPTIAFKATLDMKQSSLIQNFVPDVCYDCASQLMDELNERTK